MVVAEEYSFLRFAETEGRLKAYIGSPTNPLDTATLLYKPSGILLGSTTGPSHGVRMID